MIKLEIPGEGELVLDHLVLDVNGTLAIDGQLLPDIADLLSSLRDHLTIHLLTSGHARETGRNRPGTGPESYSGEVRKGSCPKSSLCEENRS